MAFLFSPVLYWVPGGGLGSPYPANGLEFVAQGVLVSSCPAPEAAAATTA